jgi:hypothetical protein
VMEPVEIGAESCPHPSTINSLFLSWDHVQLSAAFH